MSGAKRGLSAIAAAMALVGCVSLLPKAKPAQLWRFGIASSPPAGPSSAASRAIRLEDIDFAPAAGGDRILTFRGAQAAYIAGARWVSPARTLFEAAIRDAFAERGGSERLLGPGELAPAAYDLKIDVRLFEVDYSGAAPTVRISLDAAAITASGAAADYAKAFSAEVPAGANRVGAIVMAYDAAVQQITAELVGWTLALPPAR